MTFFNVILVSQESFPPIYALGGGSYLTTGQESSYMIWLPEVIA